MFLDMGLDSWSFQVMVDNSLVEVSLQIDSEGTSVQQSLEVF